MHAMHNCHENNIEFFIKSLRSNDFIVKKYTLPSEKCAWYNIASGIID